MKTKLLLLAITAVILVFSSCEKKENESTIGEVQFSVDPDNSNLKGALNDPDAKLVSLTIENSSKTLVIDTSLVLTNFSGTYLSSPLALKPDNYKLTKFIVLDENNAAIYATPIKDSPKAYLVTNPLEIEFTVAGDEVTKVSPEVIRTENLEPKEFGYYNNAFKVVNTIDFLISVLAYNETSKSLELTTANLNIAGKLNSGDYQMLYSFDVVAKTNKFSVNQDYASYKLRISKAGYLDYNLTLTADSLKSCFEYPIIVILKKPTLETGLVAYYPFDGNAQDESGNNNDGTVTGALLSTDRKGNANAAYIFDGVDDYIEILPNSQIAALADYTISAWVKLDDWDLIHLDKELVKRQFVFDVHSDQNNYKAGPSLILDYTKTSQEEITLFVLFDNPGWPFAGYYKEKKSPNALGKSWHHIAYTKSNNGFNLYLDGNLISNFDFNVGEEVSGVADIRHRWYIGTFGANTFSDNFNFKGTIDDVYFYDRALSTDEVKLLFNK